MAEALYAYTDVSNTTSQQQHLTLAIGDRVEIINKGDDGWWLGKINGQTGLFPGNYVRELPLSSNSSSSSSSALLSLGLTAAGTTGSSDNSGGTGGTADDIEQERAFEGEQVQEQVLCSLAYIFFKYLQFVATSAYYTNCYLPSTPHVQHCNAYRFEAVIVSYLCCR
jgi:Variant SH3 domain